MNDLDTTDLIPKNDLERAFIQARYCNSLHSWKRGTKDLFSGKVGTATGKYLAMVRIQCLDGYNNHAEATIDCIWDYNKQLSRPEKFSIIRIICSLLEEQQQGGSTSVISSGRIRSRLLQMAAAFAGNLAPDKTTQVEALTLIKKATDEDLIGAGLLRKQIALLNNCISECKLKLSDSTEDSQKVETETLEPRKSESVLSAIFSQADQIPTDLAVFLLLTKFADYLLKDNRLTEGLQMCTYVTEYGADLLKGNNSTVCAVTISRVFEKALASQDELNPFVLDAGMEEFTLGRYLKPTVRKNTKPEAFEEHYLSWLEELSFGALQSIVTQESADQSSFELSADLIIAHQLNSLTDQLIIEDKYAEACACSQMAVRARIQANSIGQRDLEDLSLIATEALLSKKYDSALRLYSDLRTMTQLSARDSLWSVRLGTYIDMLCHLFELLTTSEHNLDVRSLSTANYVMTHFAIMGQTQKLDQLLDQLLELLSTRTDNETLGKVLKLYWTGIVRLPHTTLLESYILRLSMLTERIEKTLANSYYIDFLNHLHGGKIKALERAHVVSMLTRIRSEREIEGSKNLLTIIPLVAAQARFALEAGDFQKCGLLSKKVQDMDKSELLAMPPDSMLKIQCVQAFLQIEIALVAMEKCEPHSWRAAQTNEFASLIEEVLRNTSNPDQTEKEFCDLFCDFLGALIQKELRTPEALKRSILNTDNKILAKSVDALTHRYKPEVLLELLNEIIQIKSDATPEGKNSASLIPLLLQKTEHLQNISNLNEVDKVYLQIIKLEKLIASDAGEGHKEDEINTSRERDAEKATRTGAEAHKTDRVFQAQMELLRSLTARRDFDRAFELAFELVAQTTGKFGKEQTVELFQAIDKFIANHRYSDSINLMLAILPKVQFMSIDKSMHATFDIVFLSCLQQSEYEKAELLLNRTQKVATDAGMQFVILAATRFARATTDPKEFRFEKLTKALEQLHQKKIPCWDLEIFARFVSKFSAS